MTVLYPLSSPWNLLKKAFNMYQHDYVRLLCDRLTWNAAAWFYLIIGQELLRPGYVNRNSWMAERGRYPLSRVPGGEGSHHV